MHDITPDEFITTLFPPDLLLPDECICVARPAQFVSRETGETVDYYQQMRWRPGCLNHAEAWYFCVSTVVAQRQRQIKKRLSDVRAAMVLVVDDVGTKSKVLPVQPSYKLETSQGNFQWGYLLEPFDVSLERGADYYDRCLLSLAAAGFNDIGFRSANRLARLPFSMHKSGFCARVRDWTPRRSWVLEELMEEFDVPLLKALPRRAAASRAPGTVKAIAEIADPLYWWLVMEWGVRGCNADFMFIDCPWKAGHTDGLQGATATGFSPWGYGQYMDRGFKCLHGHCAGYGTRQFEEWARSRGADIDLPGVL